MITVIHEACFLPVKHRNAKFLGHFFVCVMNVLHMKRVERMLCLHSQSFLWLESTCVSNCRSVWCVKWCLCGVWSDVCVLHEVTYGVLCEMTFVWGDVCVCLVDFSRFSLVGRLVGHSGAVGTMAILSKGLLATGSRDRLVKVCSQLSSFY